MNNKLTDEEISELALKLFDGSSFYFQSGRRPGAKTMAELLNKAACAVAELQERRKADSAEPIYQYRIRNGYNGQVTEWQTIRRDQVDFVLKAQPLNAEFRIISAPQPAPVVPEGLRMALSNAGIAAPESDEMLAATHEKYIQMLVTWVKDRKPFRTAIPGKASVGEMHFLGDGERDYVRGWNDCRSAMLQGGAK